MAVGVVQEGWGNRGIAIVGYKLRRAGRIAAVLVPFALGACQTIIKPTCGDDGCSSVPPVHEPKVTGNPTMHALACDLDHLEKHVDWYGSVVAKAPDVWGQARLTRYREEFDILMNPMKDENQFHLGLQGSLARSDQAFFAQATALSLAAQPKPPVIGRVESTKVEAPAMVPTGQTVQVVATDPATGLKTTTDTTFTQPTPTTPPAAPAAPAPAAPAATAAKGLLTNPDEAIKRELVAGRGIGFGALKADGIGLEPSLMLAQKKRYLDFLGQLRRENEGDDTADAPAYSLNLIRVPVSVLPGKRTDVGHGAEITMTLTPVLGDDLLPVTFRNLVANDLLHQLGFPLTQVLDDKDVTKHLNADAKSAIVALPKFNDYNDLIGKVILCETPSAVCAVTRHLLTLTPIELSGFRIIVTLLDTGDRAALLKIIEETETAIARGAAHDDAKVCAAVLEVSRSATKNPNAEKPRLAAQDYKKQTATVEQKLRKFAVKLPVPPMSYSAGLTNKTGFPTSQLLDVYGLSGCFQIAFAAHTALQESITRQNYAHLPDVQGFLQQEIAAAYRFLAEPGCQHLWQQFCTREMVTAVRTRNLDVLQAQRRAFRDQVKAITGDSKKSFNEPGEYSTTAALAWCILIDSALLNDRLVRDMKEAASAKKQAAPSADYWPQYYLPEPPAEARCAFNAYVAMRWPIRVFALDPYSQDQNIADQFSSRREMQLALSIAFTNGFIGANTLTKYTRRLEADYETIALNRTQVGFSHGENTFGWRFYPRFQTPDTESNMTVFFRDQLIGGPSRNALLRQRRLEPGPRECVAVVMMPSFVPYATLDTTSNWFGLANPKHKVLDHTQALKLSHTVHTIKNAGCGVKDANCYRDGELDRLLRRAEQLEARLPAQTLSVPVPVLNTLGGFEMFSNGTTDLAPELYGWYGAPGVSADDHDTTLFLVGDHFSPLNTRVIVGNREVPKTDTAYNQKMLSRQVVQVTVSKGTLTVLKDGKPHVTAHIATPYGVTRELLIPVVSTKTLAPKPGFAFNGAKLTVAYGVQGVSTNGTPTGLFLPVPKGVAEKELKIAWTAPGGTLAGEVTVEFEFTYGTATLKVPCTAEVVATGNAKEVTIKKADLERVAADVLLQIAARGSLSLDNNPLTQGLKSSKVTLTPKVPVGFVAQPAETVDALQIEFKEEGVCPVEPKAEPPFLIQPAPVPVPAQPPVPAVEVPGKTVIPLPPGLTLPAPAPNPMPTVPKR